MLLVVGVFIGFSIGILTGALITADGSAQE